MKNFTHLTSIFLFSISLLACRKEQQVCMKADEKHFKVEYSIFETCADAHYSSWEFGDGIGTVGRSVSHLYTRTGNLTVILKQYAKDGRNFAQTEKNVLVGFVNIDSIVIKSIVPQVFWDTDGSGTTADLYFMVNGKRSIEVYDNFSVAELPFVFRFEEPIILTNSTSASLVLRDRNPGNDVDLSMLFFKADRSFSGIVEIEPSQQIVIDVYWSLKP
jgi:hypothetical protein